MGTIKILSREAAMALPVCLALSDRLGYLSWRIRAHTSGYYSHAFWVVRPGEVATQEPFRGLVRSSLDGYLTGAHRVKFWFNPEWDLARLQVYLENDLANPRPYDYLGILGQMLRITVIQWPGRWYCSEHAVRPFLERVVRPYAYVTSPSPQALDLWASRQPEMQVLGAWDPGLGSR
jgi:hypothetical protein